MQTIGNPGAFKQLGDGLLRLQVTTHCLVAYALHIFRAVQHLHIGLLAKYLQGAGQRLRRDIEAHCLGLDLCGIGCGQCQAQKQGLARGGEGVA